jgi:hypothetical protein
MGTYRTSKYDGIGLEEYKGTYSLQAMREGADGEYRPVWAKYRKGKDLYQEKAWPVKVNLGDKKTAVGILEALLAEITKGDTSADNTIPF